ncbi:MULTISPECIES: LysR family transcriptional regulator [unclassified Salinivibrio]|uniref:LysR family transcriptional regulator n=1 Tax=unclassified Salinivibrio TaxID=2636825 RepID=UPI0009853727|nr:MULTISPECIES: LysR family transcriptional regulator [unclassified Salinivibrio]OOE92572.1 LysR family transcriptional regulator [Salinivibrio sp. AR647]OOF02498.1 LysR family transcriptional regulator [Salinivibrio sp. MA607]
MVNPVWLKTFCTLVDVGTFTKAADKCYMTQSGVSQHVRKLEESLSSTLVIRGKKGVVLTEAGQQLYRQGKDVLQTLDNLAVTISRDPGYEGEVRIMSPGSVGLRLYTRLLDLQVTYPALTINYRFAPNGDVHKAILNNTIDIGLTTACPVDPNIQSEPIGEEPLLLVTPRHIKDPTWETLCQLGFIDHPDARHHAELLLGANFEQYQTAQLRPVKQSGFSNQISLILLPVARGLGFTVLPANAVAAFAQQAAIKAHYLPTPVSETLYLSSLAGRELPQRAINIANVTKEHVGDSINRHDKSKE